MLSFSSSSLGTAGVTLSKDGKERTLMAVSDDESVTPKYRLWTTDKPVGDGWGVLNFHPKISNRTIAGWSATVPKGKTVTFVTTMKK